MRKLNATSSQDMIAFHEPAHLDESYGRLYMDNFIAQSVKGSRNLVAKNWSTCVN